MKQTNPELIQQAMLFATIAHTGQVRKNNGMPYVTHVIAVADIVRRYTTDSDIVAAAVLHDTIEDCDEVEYNDIVINFGTHVANLVMEVTKVSCKKTDHSRASRKGKDLIHYVKAGNAGQLIKGADILHNISDLNESQDVEWKFMFLEEKRELTKGLKLLPDDLRDRINECIDSYYD